MVDRACTGGRNLAGRSRPWVVVMALWNYRDQMRVELDWYSVYGRYKKHRLAKERSTGQSYVIGDFSWNKKYPWLKEFVEDRMVEHVRQYRKRNGR